MAWATVDELKSWMNLPDGAGDDTVLQDVLTVAQTHQEKRLDAELVGGTEDVFPPDAPEDVKTALLMRANSLYRRRQTPEGVAGIGDLAVVRVGGIDRDVELLEGPYREFGFT